MTAMPPLRSLVMLACACAAATTADGQSAPPKADETASTTVSRDPFWPIGYAPKPKFVEVPTVNVASGTTVVAVAVNPPPPPPEEPIVWPELRTRGIMHDRAKGKYWATLDGVGIVEAGDHPEITKGGYVYRFEIKAITATGVSYAKSSVRKVRKPDK
jgi:hypothetical protein